MESDHDDTFSTTDLYVAAFLGASGAKLVERPRDSYGRTTFVFEHDSINDLVDAFLDGTAKIDTLRYSEAIKRLKSLVMRGGR